MIKYILFDLDGTLTNPKEGGLGLFIIQTLMDEVNISSKGNQGTTIKMTKYLGVDI